IFSTTGELKYLLVSGSFNERNGEAIFDGYIIDLSEQKRTEQALRASEEKFRIATENSDISFWTYDFKKTGNYSNCFFPKSPWLSAHH
ncbi:MAG: hypothetical protein ACRCSI_13870, partial [Eubacterium aggregans]